MKEEWSEPTVVEIPTKMTEDQVKKHGSGDLWVLAELNDLSDLGSDS